MTPHAQQVQSRFDGEAQNWNAHYHSVAENSIYAHNLLRRRQKVQSLIGDLTGNMLEIGCGAGNILLDMPAGATVKRMGIDFSKGMLKQAKHNAQTQQTALPLLAADAMDLPFASNSTDAILCLGVLEYIPDYTRVLAECHRILKPSGSLIVSVPNATSPFIRMDDLIFGLKNAITRTLLPKKIRHIIKTQWLGRPDKPYFNHKKQRMNPAHFIAHLEAHAFQVCEQHYHTFGFGLLEGKAWNIRISKFIETQLPQHPKLEKMGWTHILKAVKS